MAAKNPLKLSSQAQAVYQLLAIENQGLTVNKLALALKVLPQGLYRILAELQVYGLVSKENNYPVRYKAAAFNESAEIIQLLVRSWLQKISPNRLKIRSGNIEPEISFFQGREESLTKSTADLCSCQKQACLIVSGHEIPAEVILACKQAIDRRVQVKIIVQQYNEQVKQMLCSWQKMGIQVRVSRFVGIRLFILDGQIVYLSSYEKKDKNKSLGVRINYQPIGFMMKQLFLNRWHLSTPYKG